jgi:hypothetical protein
MALEESGGANYRTRREVCGARFIAIAARSVYRTGNSPHSIHRVTMPARIYKPSKTAMQSGSANTKSWVLDFEPEAPRRVEPLMGWTSSGDMRQQLRLRFGTREEAIAYCERHGIAYQVFETTPVKRRAISYADNFSFRRRDAWTH